jgi:hypothetical protein
VSLEITDAPDDLYANTTKSSFAGLIDFDKLKRTARSIALWISDPRSGSMKRGARHQVAAGC